METTISGNHMAGKVYLVTGATSGIGKVTATVLASQGAEVVIIGRNQEKSEATIHQIISETGNETVHYLLADFSDLEQVRQLVMDYKARFSRLDVLVNNAGSFFNTRRETQYGVEKTFLVNHLAPFLLTNLLLETIQGSPYARIINVSSDAHQYGSMDFDDLGFKRGYVGMKAYARSKLANILFTYETVKRLGESGVTVNALHPGHVATDIWRTNFSFVGPALKRIMGLFALTPEEGADNTIYLASSPNVAGVTGKYFVKREPFQSSLISYDEEIAKKLWEISEDLTAIAQTGSGAHHQTISIQSGA
jgi:NAD(P)-dependent dehydrogenase (short-subunit alcohol dehydrogenase family)